MKKKGFTLIELLAVITIMAIMVVIATPNIIGMLSKGKKEQYVADASNMISKAKYMYSNKDRYPGAFTTSGSCSLISIANLGLNDSQKKDAFGDPYDLTNSRVQVCVQDNKYVYSISLKSEKHCLGCDDYIAEDSIVVGNVIEKK